jgi:hypothetical protein
VAVVSAAPSGTSSFVNTIALLGDGGSIQTQQLVTGSITSTGPLGGLILSASQGLIANVTAPSIFGNIQITSGPIASTIQTTGQRIDPSTGIVTTVSADLGHLLTDSTGHIVGTTTVQASGGGLTGRLISRGNLVSTISLGGGDTGVIAAQGDIGAIQRDASGSAIVDSSGHLTRFGGILVGGGLGGQVIALGNIFCDITANGIPSGRIAVKGSAVAGLAPDRFGIFGNININGNIDSGGAIICAGRIGDALGGTTLSVNNVKGILAAKGDINFGQVGNLSAGAIFESATGVDAAAIDAIFTSGGLPLVFDVTGLDLAGLSLILADVATLHVGPDGHLTGTQP